MKKKLHIMVNDKFTMPFIEFINANFPPKEHLFLVVGNDENDDRGNNQSNIRIIRKDIKSLLILIIEMYKHEKIILHGLFLKPIVAILFLQPLLLKKCNWVVWGGDLYCYCHKRATLKGKVEEMMRRVVIRNFGGLITHIKGDYELAQTWYGAKGKYNYSFMYPSNLFKDYDLSKVSKYIEKAYIQIGNSADPSNRHVEIFEKLIGFNDKDFEIICPLSYGDSNYAKAVIKKGQELFGEKFNPLTEFISFEKYLEVLAKIDIAIFNHRRQQAVGNITTLLSFGKKVYIRDDIMTWGFCLDHGLKVYSTNNGIHTVFKPIPHEVKKKNSYRMKEQFSEEKLMRDWKMIFEEN